LRRIESHARLRAVCLPGVFHGAVSWSGASRVPGRLPNSSRSASHCLALILGARQGALH
jgi:hypothetical protein